MLQGIGMSRISWGMGDKDFVQLFGESTFSHVFLLKTCPGFAGNGASSPRVGIWGRIFLFFVCGCFYLIYKYTGVESDLYLIASQLYNLGCSQANPGCNSLGVTCGSAPGSWQWRASTDVAITCPDAKTEQEATDHVFSWGKAILFIPFCTSFCAPIWMRKNSFIQSI